MYLLIALATLIGILLGLLGGGGSILTVPVLVYIAGLSAKNAIVTSLIVVGITSLIAVINHAKRGFVCWKTGLTFSLAGMFGAFFGGRSAAYIPDPVLLVLFAVVMSAAAIAMIRSNKTAQPEHSRINNLCPVHLPVLAILLDGLIVGFITGLVGVGGGFLLVPALNFLAGLPMHAAIGTSLFIIVLQSGAALAGHASHMHVDLTLTSTITGFAIIGSFLGSLASSRISSRHLKRGFGIFVFCLGGFLLYREINIEIVQQIKQLARAHRDFLLGGLTVICLLVFYRLWLWMHTLRRFDNT
ncbi:MAG: sulfite exporter TauE/SafE family protein [Gammaproteobacteria bacterium]